MDSSSCHDSAFPFEESSADTSADQELDIFSKKTSPFAALQPSSCIVAVVVIIVALIAASLILPRVKAPRKLVASYVRAVVNGDFEHATQLANPNVPQSARALFAHGVLDANHRITSYDIDFKHESFSPVRYSVHLFYILGNKQGEQYRGSGMLRLHMKPNGSWAFDQSLLNVMKLPRSERFTVNGVPVSDIGFNLNSICPTSKKYCKSKLMLDIDDDDFYVPAYPGIYAVSTPLPADNPKLFTVVQRDIFIPDGSSNTRVPETSGTDGNNAAGSADSSGNTDRADATSTDDTESDRYRYGETRSDDGTWVPSSMRVCHIPSPLTIISPIEPRLPCCDSWTFIRAATSASSMRVTCQTTRARSSRNTSIRNSIPRGRSRTHQASSAATHCP